MGLKSDVRKAHASDSKVTGSLKKSAHATPKKVTKKKRTIEDFTVFVSPKGDVLIESPNTSERATIFGPVEIPKGSEKVATYSDFKLANDHAQVLIARRKAQKAHKSNPSKLSANDFSYLAEMLKTLPASYGDVVINHCAEFMAQTNDTFDYDRFFAAVGSGRVI